MTPRHLGLRARATAAWALGALALSVGLSIFAYALTRTELVSEREEQAQAQAYLNARLLRSGLRADDPDVTAILSSLGSNTGSEPVAWIDGTWFSGSVGVGPDSIPSSLRDLVASGEAGTQIADVDDEPHVVVGVPVAESGSRYFELVALTDVDDALTSLARGLTAAAVATTLAGAAAGWYASRRILSPVRRLSAAAGEIAAGDLTTRLDAFGDQDLEPLQRSFNQMADAVEDRVERERSFTSDVSHELRSPLAAMSSAIEIARRRVDDPGAVDDALADLEARTDAFRHLVVDLLEISRMEAGVADFHAERVDACALVAAALEVSGVPDTPVTVGEAAPEVVVADKRRVGQMVLNLVENADRYGGGVTGLHLDGSDGHLTICVDDDGPGVPDNERRHIFGRFARGDAGRRATTDGTGLGLALVAEHARLHHGRVRVGTSPTGGARFTIELPIDLPAAVPAGQPSRWPNDGRPNDGRSA